MIDHGEDHKESKSNKIEEQVAKQQEVHRSFNLQSSFLTRVAFRFVALLVVLVCFWSLSEDSMGNQKVESISKVKSEDEDYIHNGRLDDEYHLSPDVKLSSILTSSSSSKVEGDLSMSDQSAHRAESSDAIPSTDGLSMSDDAPCLLYLRVPKTGSSSLLARLEDSLGMKAGKPMCFSNGGMSSLRDYQVQTRKRQVDANTSLLFQGHCSYGFHSFTCAGAHTTGETKRSRHCPYYTWLREPVERVISSIAYNHHGSITQQQIEPIKKCLQQKPKKGECPKEYGPNWSNTMTYRLGADFTKGEDVYDKDQGVLHVTRENLEIAKERLMNYTFFSFGLLGYASESLEMLEAAIIPSTSSNNDSSTDKVAPPPPVLGHEGTVHSIISKELIVRELTDVIKGANELDIELYEFAKALFEERYSQYQKHKRIEDMSMSEIFNSHTATVHSCLEEMR